MTIHYQDEQITLHHGDALETARTLPSASVQTIVTSPPYFGLRDYGEDGQIGAEDSLGEYIDRLVTLFRELRRVLKDDGTFWLNLGDSYRNKQLLGVPWQAALALQRDGWVLRNEIVWAKANAMPESVTDRLTSTHESVFMLSKSRHYYFDLDAIRKPLLHPEKGTKEHSTSYDSSMKARRSEVRGARAEHGKNPGDVWTVSSEPFPGGHFAPYPSALIRPCIRAGSSPGDTILDPFSGSGTTGAVATFEGRKYVGIDLNREYLDLSLRTRFAQPTLAWPA